jgi:anti-anti-sigma factor
MVISGPYRLEQPLWSGGITVTITYLSSVQERAAVHGRRVTRSTSLVVARLELPGTPSRLFLAAQGDVDADNAKRFSDEVCATIAGSGAAPADIWLDLSGLDFFAVDGCTALYAINAQVMRMGASWSVIPSRAVSRVLQLCDPACLIPVTRAEELAAPA